MHTEDRKNDQIAEDEQTEPGVPWFAAGRDAGQPAINTTTLERSTNALRRALDRLERTL